MRRRALSAACAAVFAPVLAAVFVTLALALPSTADAQSYPNRPIKVVVPFAPGGNTDVMGRVLAAKMSELLGQQVAIENRTGAGSVVGTEIVARATPDGYTLLLTTVAHAANPAFYKKLTYDAVKDFDPIGLAAISPLVLEVHPTIPATLPGYQGYTWGGLFAPAGTPKPIIAQLASALAKTVADPAVRQRMEELGNEVNENPTPEGLAKFLAEERTKWLTLFEGQDIKLD